MKEKIAYPEQCPHCGKSIMHLRPVGDRVLDAARALLLPNVSTSRDVARVLSISVPNAGVLLHRAMEHGLIAKVGRVRSHSSGGATYEYKVAQRMAAYAPLAYKQYLRQHNKVA